MVRSSQRASLFIVLFLAACGFLGMVFAQKNPATAHDSDSDVSQSLQQFTQVYDIVEQNYAETVTPDKAIYNGAIPGMLHVLDPHSNFLPPEVFKDMKVDTSGKFGGVGIEIGVKNDMLAPVFPARAVRPIR